ncbi:MAG: formate dehydrogenase accessory sulfurtransferase FdhD [Planctomycetes bacterium]|nr:formate dehydrogenase accessory sulfurtransferase FdhD [Planctomycetota bacterium]
MPDRGMKRPGENRADRPTLFTAHSDPVPYLHWRDGKASPATKPMVLESAWTFSVNGEHWLTVLCTPAQMTYLALGFLYNEGLIAAPDDVADLQVGPGADRVIRVELRDRSLRPPRRRTLTSGCGGGVTFVDLAATRESIRSSLRVTANQVLAALGRLQEAVRADHRRIGGFHTSGLSDGRELLVVSMDIGRHNTLDRIAGECLDRGIPMADALLLTTGRVSAEMLGKAARMQTPVIASVNSPTHLAVQLAHQWGITLVGYARGSTLHIYTHPERILAPQ